MARPLAATRLVLRMPLRKLPGVIVTDWDETITVDDTILLVAETAYLAKPSYSPAFSHFTDVYLKAYGDYSRSFGERTTLEQEKRFQQGLGPVEAASIDEITRLALFRGTTPAQYRSQASKVKLRGGFIDFMKKAKQQNVPVVILSVNWTRHIMDGVLEPHGFGGTRIFVNELEQDRGVCTGRFDSRVSVRTGLDKLAVVEKLREEHGLVVYVGDSSIDLFSLLAANVGVVMEDGSVRERMEQLGVSVLPLESFAELPDEATGKHDGGPVYTGGWNDVSTLLDDTTGN